MSGPWRVTRLDKTGRPFETSTCRLADGQCLAAMYNFFSPKAVHQGLPPADEEARRVWIEGLLERGQNFLAWVDDQVVGHAGLLPDYDEGKAEFIIFVIRAHRHRGLGSALTALAIQRARELGLKLIWLTVETYNFTAIRLYQKFGFEFCESCECERKMLLRL